MCDKITNLFFRFLRFDRARRMSGSRDDVGIVPYAGCRMVWFDRAGGISGLRDDVGIVPCAKKAKTRLALLGSAG